jgi:hypothetical protein
MYLKDVLVDMINEFKSEIELKAPKMGITKKTILDILRGVSLSNSSSSNDLSREVKREIDDID